MSPTTTAQVMFAIVTVLGAGGVSAWLTAWSRRSVDAATSRKTDVEAAVMLLGEHRKDNAALREELGVLKSDMDHAHRETVELRMWAIEINRWAEHAVTVIHRLNAEIDAPPTSPDRRRTPRPPEVAP